MQPDFVQEIRDEVRDEVRKEIEAEIAQMKQPKEDEEGNIYEGEWANGMKNGFGKQRYEDGTEYEGQWKDGKEHGYGKMKKVMSTHSKDVS